MSSGLTDHSGRTYQESGENVDTRPSQGHHHVHQQRNYQVREAGCGEDGSMMGRGWGEDGARMGQGWSNGGIMVG